VTWLQSSIHPVDTYEDYIMLSMSSDIASRCEFLTTHAHVLLCVAHDPGIRLRDVAQTVGITERSAHRIISELVDEGYVVRERVGRRNVYRVKPELPLRHPLAQETEQRRIGDLLEVLLGKDGGVDANAGGLSSQ
jgi:predicted DNA-binding transcriptional regulator